MPCEVTITTGARLHFGPLSYAPGTGRHFGGLGMMIDSPGFVIKAAAAEQDDVVGTASIAARAKRLMALYRERCPADRPPPCRLEIRSEIPVHCGLGSGTQFGLALAQALSILGGSRDWGAVALSPYVERGARSAVGCHGFDRGGLLVDGGKRTADDLGTLVARHELCDDWRFLLVTPAETTGLAGVAEADAFARLPPMPQSTTDRLCRLIVMDLLPAVLAADCDACGEAIYEYGRLVGEYFAPVQGGAYADPRMRTLVDELRARGLRGVGQSSWGPTIFILLPDETTAEALRSELAGDPRWAGCRLHIAAPLNHGAVIETC